MGKLRVIDQGTRYDITGKLRMLTRKIERGEIKPRDLLVITTETIRNNSSPMVMLHHYGQGSTENIHWMLSTAANRIEPR